MHHSRRRPLSYSAPKHNLQRHGISIYCTPPGHLSFFQTTFTPLLPCEPPFITELINVSPENWIKPVWFGRHCTCEFNFCELHEFNLPDNLRFNRGVVINHYIYGLYPLIIRGSCESSGGGGGGNGEGKMRRAARMNRVPVRIELIESGYCPYHRKYQARALPRDVTTARW